MRAAHKAIRIATIGQPATCCSLLYRCLPAPLRLKRPHPDVTTAVHRRRLPFLAFELLRVEFGPKEPPGRDRVDSSEHSACEGHTLDLIRIIFAILLPPLGVFLQVGFGGAFWLNILLTLLGYIPGIIHAVWIIARR